MYAATIAEMTMTMIVSRTTVWRSGQVTFCSSDQHSWANRTTPTLPVLRRPVGARAAGRARERDDRSVVLWHLGEHLRYDARSDGVPAFADGESESFFECDRGPERDLEVDVITRDDHLAALR